jgi:hypothetical protein
MFFKDDSVLSPPISDSLCEQEMKLEDISIVEGDGDVNQPNDPNVDHDLNCFMNDQCDAYILATGKISLSKYSREDFEKVRH